MEQAIGIIAILGTLLLGAMSPGPSFLVVARVSLAGSRGNAIATSVGLGIGSALFGCIALAGLHVVLEQVAWAYIAFKIVGGGYLIYLAYRILSGAKTPLHIGTGTATPSVVKALLLGIATQLSNPKTAVVFASVFATFLTTEPAPWLYMTLIPLIFLMETAWYSLIACAFASTGPRTVYGKAKTGIDRAAGALLGAMGAKLVTDAA